MNHCGSADQTVEAVVESMTLMGVHANIVTPRNGEPLIAATQDFITASYLLTRKNVFLDFGQFCMACAYLGDALDWNQLPQVRESAFAVSIFDDMLGACFD